MRLFYYILFLFYFIKKFPARTLHSD